MPSFESLFSLQALDTSIDRLRHDLRQEERHRERTAAEQAIGRIRAAAAPQLQAKRDLEQEELELDTAATEFRTKAEREEARMYSGDVTSPKELQAMQTEVNHLKASIAEIEVRELTLMEQEMALTAEIETALEPIGAIEAQVQTLTQEIEAETERLEQALGEVNAQRATLVSGIDPSHVEVYEQCRAQSHGVGIARLVHGACGGCHLSVPTSEAERIRNLPPDGYELCDNCGCMLVG